MPTLQNPGVTKRTVPEHTNVWRAGELAASSLQTVGTGTVRLVTPGFCKVGMGAME